MTSSSVGLARGILRNAGALFLVGVFAKGMGLVIAILIARFLGADAMGLFALLFSVAMLVETFISIGMSGSLVRDVAARPRQAHDLCAQARKLVLLISLVPALALAAWALLKSGDAAMRNSLLVVAIGAPISGAFVVSQAVLQGLERVLFLTWVTFVARVVSLVWLVIALYRGGGVEAAFVSRVLFQALAVVVFSAALRRQPTDESSRFSVRELFTRSIPFALNQGLRDLAMRLPSLMLPATLGLAASGVFDTANRIRSTLGMTVSAAIVGMMPTFARTLSEPGDRSERVVGFSIKYMCLSMAAVATVIGLLADWLVRLLFGPAFADAALPLQILSWAQVLAAVDAVLQQVILARGRAYAAVVHSAAGVLCQVALIVLLTYALGLQGAAWAVLIATALALWLDLRFVVRHVSAVPIRQFVVAPIAAACVAGIAVILTREWAFSARIGSLGASWLVLLVLFRLLPREELIFMRQLVPALSARRGGSL